MTATTNDVISIENAKGVTKQFSCFTVAIVEHDMELITHNYVTLNLSTSVWHMEVFITTTLRA